MLTELKGSKLLKWPKLLNETFFKKRQTKNFRRTYLTWLDKKFAQKSGIISIRSNK
jgi:hypothetical protein